MLDCEPDVFRLHAKEAGHLFMELHPDLILDLCHDVGRLAVDLILGEVFKGQLVGNASPGSYGANDGRPE